ncbi:MAG: bifunctional (p)ppGpp synthetase/guanosine-3',5'-bis(diphosphate) 3'-pyrophosphohydrolase [Thermoanaerobaculia bacterium]|nr:bifunctional (p)ppGpp synthetase/guanosine-3',5'-bis(diphosphate) 3'-pyrophosphohydrolase [Thermoanaerobaculia bacterium]
MVKRLPKPPIRPRKNVDFDLVVERLEQHDRAFDHDLLRRVHEFSAEKHRDQRRKSGEPYLTHPVYVSYILADLKFDATCVAVGLLHDVLEDTLTTKEVLEKEFGRDIAELVDGVTKISMTEYVRRDQAQAETFRKMILASAKDLRVILVKLADRLHNMMTLEHMSPDSRRRIASETLEIYAPIALRLGMSKLQGELEDLAFYYRYPRQFAELDTKLRDKMRAAKSSIQRIARQLTRALEQASIAAEISYRVKRYYSIFRKLQRQGIDISQLYDFLAFRVITSDLKDTYAAFGVVHQNWRPIPGRFKDYIAMPKPNLYQSLHTTVVGEKGQPFEVQIRTEEMDLVAEEGIAAHWQYKEGESSDRADNDPNILWLRQLLEWQKEVQDPREFLTALKIDLYPDEVYVFTPQGDVKSFPRGATPLDFAYRIHTDIGHHCSGARVNGKLVPLKTSLRNGDMVEILTSPQRHPSRDWLNYVVTTRARSKIRHWLNTEQAKEAEAIGRRILERELRKLDLAPKKVLDGEKLASYLQREGLARVQDLYQRVAYGKTPFKQVIAALVDQDEKEAESGWRRAVDRAVDRFLPFGGKGPILVKGHGDLLASLAKCCEPVPGEPVVGYVTRGRGISVHAVGCPNLKKLSYDRERVVEVEWAKANEARVFPVSLMIETEDHKGILARLTDVIARESSNIRQFEAEAVETGRGLIDVVVEVKNRKHLDRLAHAIENVPGVLHVTRGSHAVTQSVRT